MLAREAGAHVAELGQDLGGADCAGSGERHDDPTIGQRGERVLDAAGDYRENADTTTAQGKLIFGIMASLAEFERALIAERVKAGMARAKAQGKHVGRPRIPAQKEAAIRRDLLAGQSLRSTIRAHGVGSKTVQRIKAELADQTSA